MAETAPVSLYPFHDPGMSKAMRVLLRGEGEVETRAIAAALRRGGLAIVDPGEEAFDPCGFDLIVTVGGALSVIRIGAIEIDLAMRATRLAGRDLRLTRIEQALLVALARARRPIGRAALLDAVWGYRFDPGTNLVAVHMHRLRAKIGHARIACGPAGYRLTDGDG